MTSFLFTACDVVIVLFFAGGFPAAVLVVVAVVACVGVDVVDVVFPMSTDVMSCTCVLAFVCICDMTADNSAFIVSICFVKASTVFCNVSIIFP